MSLSIFDLLVTTMLPTKFQVKWFFGSGKTKQKIDFHDGSHQGFPTGMILAIFWSTSQTQCFLPSFNSNSLSVQKENWKLDFQDGGHGGHLGFSIGLTLVFKFQVSWEKKREIDGGNLGFPNGTISAIFYLQVTPMLPTKFKVKWPRGVGGEGF